MKKNLDPNKLIVGIKKEIKSNIISENDADNIVKSIHDNSAIEKQNITSGRSTKRITLDIEKSFHKKISQHLLNKDLSFKDYFLGLAEKDLGINKY